MEHKSLMIICWTDKINEFTEPIHFENFSRIVDSAVMKLNHEQKSTSL